MKSNIEMKRHSYSHILAAAVLEMFPEAKLAIGPAIENGFYYDFDLPRTLIPEDLTLLENKMKKIIKAGFAFEKTEIPSSDALSEAKKQKQIYKAELIEELVSKGQKTVSFYRLDGFVDLCAGPHVENTKELDHEAVKLVSIAGAYWRGDEKQKMLQRVYGVAFDDKKELEEYLNLQEEAKKRDHRKLGQELDLFSFHDEGPGFPFWHPKGMILRDLLINYWKDEHKKADYEEISTPIILREELWHQSGHWDNYKNNMYFTKIDGQGYAIKPMNCPGGIQVYKNTLHSYREFPIRMAELGLVHRHELSGVLHGLFRARAFTQDDAHIYCTEKQISTELTNVIHLVEKMYEKLGFTDYHVELSTRPPKSIGTDEMWKNAEKTMETVAKNLKLKYQLNPGDGAFYGPKFDFHIKDSIGRTWQCGTIQLDFSMPERFDLEYVDEDGSRKRPVMIHRTVLGSLERFIGVLLENYAGALPTWLSPVQVALLPVADRHVKHCQKLKVDFENKGVRVLLDDSKESVGKKIRNAEMQKIPYMLVVGDKEIESGKLSVRSYVDGDLGLKTTTELIKLVQK
jgi:threonyl-tRNA synthetase